MVPNYNDILYFSEIGRTGNISRAAERLGITQPSLSLAVGRLESSLGVTLLLRGKTGVRLTQAGQEFLNRSRQMLLVWEQLRADANRKEDSVSGRFVLGCHPSVALYSLSHFLPQMLFDFPDLQINLVHDLSRKITERIISFEVDFGLVVNPVEHPDLVIRELFRDEVSFWIARHGCKNRSVLICDPNLLQTQSLLGQLAKQKMSFSRVVHSENLEVITDLTRKGAGIGILPARVATRDSKDLRLLRKDMPLFLDRICLVYRGDLQKSRASRTIIERIKSRLATTRH